MSVIKPNMTAALPVVGAAGTIQAETGGAGQALPTPRKFKLDDRFIAPILITCILLVGQISFHILESYRMTALAILTSISVEMILGRLFTGKWPHIASAYVSGISIGILLRSTEIWPYMLCAAISITSKYVIRVNGRHLWNPSNLGIVCLLLLAPQYVATLGIQWGNTVWPMIAIWTLGAVIIYRLKRFHICATYVGCFVFYAWTRSLIIARNVVSGRSGSHHRPDVPAIHLLHDHRPENNGQVEAGADARRVPRGDGRERVSAVRTRMPRPAPWATSSPTTPPTSP